MNLLCIRSQKALTQPGAQDSQSNNSSAKLFHLESRLNFRNGKALDRINIISKVSLRLRRYCKRVLPLLKVSHSFMYSLCTELTLNIKAFYVEIHNFLCLSISWKFPGAKVKFVTLLGPHHES